MDYSKDFNKELDELLNNINSFFGVNKDSLISKTRKANIVVARQIFAYCLRKKFHLSFPVIGDILNRDHTTIIHACDKVEELLTKRKDIKRFIDSNTESKPETEEDPENVENDENIIENKINNEPEEIEEIDIDKNDLLNYVENKNKIETKEYEELLTELKEKNCEEIKQKKFEYKELLLKLKKKRKIQTSDYKKALRNLEKSKFLEAQKYLSPKKEILEEYGLKNKVKLFLPRYNENVNIYDIPIKFNEEYLNSVFKNIDNRAKSIIIKRYGLFEKEFSTLENLAKTWNLSRERIRQIINASLIEIYKNNYGASRQIINKLAEEIIEFDLISLEKFVTNIYSVNKKNKSMAIKYLLLITSIIKWIKEFEFSKSRYLINTYNEKIIFDYIDKIKSLIKKSYSGMPDLIEDKWDYIYENLKKYEFFQDKQYLLNKNFIKNCHDNYLFESEITIHKNENLKKYDIKTTKIKNTEGIPEEYEIFFK